MFRTVGYPRKYKVVLYDIALSLLPVTVTLLGSLSLREDTPNFSMGRFGELWSQGEAGRILPIAFGFYFLLLVVVMTIKVTTDKYTRLLLIAGADAKDGKDKRAERWVGIGFLILVMLGFASSFTSLKGVTPYSQLTGTLAFAILIAFISQCGLSLPKEYRAKAENKPVEVQEWMYVVASSLALVWLIWILLSWPFLTE